MQTRNGCMKIEDSSAGIMNHDPPKPKMHSHTGCISKFSGFLPSVELSMESAVESRARSKLLGFELVAGPAHHIYK